MNPRELRRVVLTKVEGRGEALAASPERLLPGTRPGACGEP